MQLTVNVTKFYSKAMVSFQGLRLVWEKQPGKVKRSTLPCSVFGK